MGGEPDICSDHLPYTAWFNDNINSYHLHNTQNVKFLSEHLGYVVQSNLIIIVTLGQGQKCLIQCQHQLISSTQHPKCQLFVRTSWICGTVKHGYNSYPWSGPEVAFVEWWLWHGRSVSENQTEIWTWHNSTGNMMKMYRVCFTVMLHLQIYEDTLSSKRYHWTDNKIMSYRTHIP